MIIVTGATGHLGNVLVKRLISEGNDVAVLAHNKPPKEVFGDLNIKVFQGDITDYKSLVDAFKDADFVYHLAAKISITSGDFEALKKINVEGTANVVKACLECKVKRLVYVSSIHAIKEEPHGTVLVENVPKGIENVIGDYAKSKILAYWEVMKAVEKGLDAVVCFPTGIIGPFDYKPSQIGQMMKNYLTGQNNYYIDGEYDYVDVRDVVTGLISAMEKGEKGEGYILGGHLITVKNMYEVFHKITNIDAKLTRIPTGVAYFFSFFAEFLAKLMKKEPLLTPYSVVVLKSNSYVKYEKAKKILGYKSRPIDETIKDSLFWHKGEKISLI
jgi:dihydroflavonol-4-reductase